MAFTHWVYYPGTDLAQIEGLFMVHKKISDERQYIDSEACLNKCIPKINFSFVFNLLKIDLVSHSDMSFPEAIIVDFHFLV